MLSSSKLVSSSARMRLIETFFSVREFCQQSPSRIQRYDPPDLLLLGLIDRTSGRHNASSSTFPATCWKRHSQPCGHDLSRCKRSMAGPRLHSYASAAQEDGEHILNRGTILISLASRTSLSLTPNKRKYTATTRQDSWLYY